jgi:endonuclease/exonuclease/phosphatase family metal-dependent hydrolase
VNETVLRVATWNLLHGVDVRTGRIELDAVADAVTALEVDVLSVQEVDRLLARSQDVDQLAALADKLGWQAAFGPALLGDPVHGWTAVEGPDPGGPAYGVGLLSPHPLTEVARLALPGGARVQPTDRRGRPDRWVPYRDSEPRAVLRAVLGLPGGTRVTVAATHLSYLAWRSPRQLRRAVAFVGAAGNPAVLLGDLNLPHRALGPALAGTGWTSGPAAGPSYPAWQPRMQIDHVLARDALVSDTRVAPRGPSDHLAITAQVMLR